jgi:hypothetical protein
MTVTLCLKKVDLEVARKIKMTAAGQGLTLKAFILAAVQRALPNDSDKRLAAVQRAGRTKGEIR